MKESVPRFNRGYRPRRSKNVCHYAILRRTRLAPQSREMLGVAGTDPQVRGPVTKEKSRAILYRLSVSGGDGLSAGQNKGACV
jgi:hypothetical protein